MTKITMFVKPLSKFDHSGEQEANDQFYYQPATERLFFVYDDDHDDELEDGSHPLHDVTNRYEVRFELANTQQPTHPERTGGDADAK